jgi:hypothetical protein
VREEVIDKEMNMKESGKRKNKGPNFNVYVGATFRHEVFCEIEALAASHKLANAQVVRELFLRGLAAYSRDGRISENAVDSELAITPFLQEAPVEFAA